MATDNFVDDFCQLGNEFIKIASQKDNPYLNKAEQENNWFTQESLRFSLKSIGNLLTKKQLKDWLSKYQINNTATKKQIGLVLAGNIPMVGFHDILCVLASGNKVLAKLSNKDKALYELLSIKLSEINPVYDSLITYTNKPLKNIDAIIATGSNNSSRYFDFYFSKYPNIIRKNRNSVAIIDESFNEIDFSNLSDDIFTYFGLGCRNVSHLLLPVDFPIKKILNGFNKHNNILNHNKYANNYEYQKAILAMNKSSFYDNGFCLFLESNNLNSPIGVINYSYYNDNNQLQNFIKTNETNIQCIVSKTKHDFNTYSIGMAQKPALDDYADNIDTIKFLTGLN